MNVSYSSISSYKRCPLRHRLDMEPAKKLALKVVENNRNVAAPSVTHKLVSMYLKSGFQKNLMMEKCEEIYAEYERTHPIFYSKISPTMQKKWGIATDRELQIARLRQAVDAMEHISAFLRWDHHRIVPDKWFTTPFTSRPPHILKGQTDVWDLDTDIVYDIKVTHDRKWGDPLQLFFYAMLISETRGYMPKEGRFIFPLVSQKYRFIEYKFTQETMAVALTAAEAYVDALKAEVFPAKPIDDNWCFFCPYKPICPKFGGKIELTPIEFDSHKVTIKGRMG